jgi:hypothetical protein
LNWKKNALTAFDRQKLPIFNEFLLLFFPTIQKKKRKWAISLNLVKLVLLLKLSLLLSLLSSTLSLLLISSSLQSLSLLLIYYHWFFIFEIFNLYDCGLSFISSLPWFFGLNTLQLLLLFIDKAGFTINFK